MRNVTTLARGAALAGVLLLAPIAAGEAGRPMPDTLYAWGDSLQYISLDRAVDGSGRPDADLLGSSLARRFAESLEKRPADHGCVELTSYTSIDLATEDFLSPEGAIQNSEHVLVGRVVGLDHGIDAIPRFGTLVAIETEQVLVGSPNTEFFVFFPKGEFRFQGRRYCVEHDHYPDLPAVGDRILVAHQQQVHGPLISVIASQLTVLPKNGRQISGRSPVLRGDKSAEKHLIFDSPQAAISWATELLREAGRQ